MDKYDDVEGSIIAHQQGKIEELEFQLSILKAESEARLRAIDSITPHLFWSIVNNKFESNLELAHEEIEATAPDDLPPGYACEPSERSAWNMAAEWTMQDLENEIGQELENRWWQKQEELNKNFYE